MSKEDLIRDMTQQLRQGAPVEPHTPAPGAGLMRVGQGMQAAGWKMVKVGLGLTLLITLPLVILLAVIL